MKTKEEINAIRDDVEALNRKFEELTGEELAQVAGGFVPHYPASEIVVKLGTNGWEDPKYILGGAKGPAAGLAKNNMPPKKDDEKYVL